jgi:hypothetical protein
MEIELRAPSIPTFKRMAHDLLERKKMCTIVHSEPFLTASRKAQTESSQFEAALRSLKRGDLKLTKEPSESTKRRGSVNAHINMPCTNIILLIRTYRS